MARRTFAIGDIHGDRSALLRLIGRFPKLTNEDTVVFIGDYVDRGPDPLGVVRAVQAFTRDTPCTVITLRGNHEDKWVESCTKPDLAFLVQLGNGCSSTYRSMKGLPPLGPEESLPTDQMREFFEVKKWFPADVEAWMSALPLWYEDKFALYVHAGLDGEAGNWKHPSASRPKPLMWMREPSFFSGYAGKRVVFGHTPVEELPPDQFASGDPKRPAHLGAAWIRGDLIGIDTGSGKGGFLTAVELPRLRVYDSR